MIRDEERTGSVSAETEHAQQIAAHESPRTTKLYDRTSEQITLDEIERIAIYALYGLRPDRPPLTAAESL